jgi:hypothetical protein
LAGINNLAEPATGNVKIELVNRLGKSILEQTFPVALNSHVRTDIPVSVVLPTEAGGYVLVAEFASGKGQPVISRRFLKVGQAETYGYFKLNPIIK